MAQMARFRQPGAAAIVFMKTLVPTEARFSVRARTARRPCSASATPRDAKTRAAASGIAASSPATTVRWRVASTIRYWAVKLTVTAAAASTHNPAAAFRSHRPERSRPDAADPGRELRTLPASRANTTAEPDRASGKAGAIAAASRWPADWPAAAAILRGRTGSPAPSSASWTRGPRATRGLGCTDIPSRAVRSASEGRISLSCLAGFTAGSGRSYYAEGPRVNPARHDSEI